MKIVEMQFNWMPQGPLLSGYDYNFATATGQIRSGEKKVMQYQSRESLNQLSPSLLASAAKGVFRSAAAWLVEREGQIVQAALADANKYYDYITVDYSSSVPDEGSWRQNTKRLSSPNRLCPVSRIFGGSGNEEDSSRNALRQQGIVSFSFKQKNKNSDALFGKAEWRTGQRFAWEVAENATTNFLETEQLQIDEPAQLCIRIQQPAHIYGAEDVNFAVVLIGMSADLISSGFFRFGRFTSRGYGWVRLTDGKGTIRDLGTLFSETKNEDETTVDKDPSSGSALAYFLLAQEPAGLLRSCVKEWIQRG